MAAAGRLPEEVMVLRCPQSVASTIRAAMADKHSSNALQVELNFRGSNTGKLVVNGQEHRVIAQSLPCALEAYKTYNGSELIKANDIGTILVALSAKNSGSANESESATTGNECRDGVCPSLHDARERFFKKPHGHSREEIAEAERTMEQTLHGHGPARPLAPDEVEFEAEWETDEEAAARREREKRERRNKKRHRPSHSEVAATADRPG